MNTTPLSFLLDTMNSYRDFENVEEPYKVRQIDTAMRMIRQKTNYPWNLTKGTLRVFDDVFEYPITSDHDEIAYIEKQDIERYADTARFFNTSIKQFYQDVNSTRNLMADIWKDGTRLIGLNYKDFQLPSSLLSSAGVASEYTASDDASGVVLDSVTFKKAPSSIQFTVTNSAGVATIKNTITAMSDTNYKNKYQFRWVYLDAVPTSIEMRLQTDDSNYLSTVVTTQFSGQAFVADDWNLIAQDLNTATETGTFDSTSIASEKTILNGAATGTYRLDQSNLRQWELMDKWYYSKNNVVSSGSSSADREYFILTSESSSDIDTTDSLLGDSKWIDFTLWTAMRLLLGDIENRTLLSLITEERNKAEQAFNAKYPTMTPLITTSRHRFNNNPITKNLNIWGTR